MSRASTINISGDVKTTHESDERSFVELRKLTFRNVQGGNNLAIGKKGRNESCYKLVVDFAGRFILLQRQIPSNINISH